ncbi:MAG TPA: hypothetical protein VND64_29410, partial [Pirellulales bacterium]|nr:hypothetical protein [Pirellulales bacterium]
KICETGTSMITYELDPSPTEELARAHPARAFGPASMTFDLESSDPAERGSRQETARPAG